MQTTPERLDSTVLHFCSSIRPEAAPVYVPVVADRQAVPRNCYLNVKRRVAEEGGSILHGWTIWYEPGRFIEAEHHAVWVSPDGRHLDVTPHVDGETRILFLPDPERVWTGCPIASVRRAIL